MTPSVPVSAPDPETIPFDLFEAEGETGAVVFASPHSGSVRPRDFGHAPDLSEASLRSAEDVLVDRLVAGGPARGTPLLVGRLSRAYVDLNRDPTELDAVLIRDLDPMAEPSAKTAAGFGVIPRRAGDGAPLYARRLTTAEAEARIEAVHRPYHAALTGLMARAKQGHGRATLIDWHSMPSRSTRVAGRAAGLDVVLGDRHGASCDAALTRRVRILFESAGLRVGLNRPYAGGYTTQIWGRPDEGFQALQIELSRGLYLDETTLEPSADYDRCQAIVERVIAAICTEAG